jgi:hypothetical protein
VPFTVHVDADTESGNDTAPGGTTVKSAAANAGETPGLTAPVADATDTAYTRP